MAALADLNERDERMSVWLSLGCVAVTVLVVGAVVRTMLRHPIRRSSGDED